MILTIALVVWLTIFVAGSIGSIRLLVEYRKARAAVPYMKCGAIRRRLATLWADANIVEEVLTLIGHICGIIVGLASIPLPRTPATREGAVFRATVSVGLIVMGVTGLIRTIYRWKKWGQWEAIVVQATTPKGN